MANTFEPFEEQEPFLWNKQRYYGYISGVGAGKTAAGVMRTALNADVWNPGEMGAIVAPTTTMIKNAIIPLMREMGLLDKWEYKSPHTDEPGLHTPSGGRILLLSADNRRTIERLAGLNLAYWWLDEAARTPARALEILTQRLRTGSYRNGYLTTTPMGRDHVFDFFVGDHEGEWREHGDGELYEARNRLAITRVPTWANPHTDDEYKEEMEAKEGQTYEREILGRFVDYEGKVYNWFDPGTHVTEYDDIPDSRHRETIYGVDWGHNNPAVVLAVKVTGDGDYHVVDEFYDSGRTVSDLVDVAQAYYDEYGRGRIYCDPAEPASIETFTRNGLDATGAENPIMPGIQTVTEQREAFRVAAHCTNLIEEFGLYRYPDGGDGEKPVDANNHALDALRYAIFTHEQVGQPSVGVAFG